MLTSLRNFTKGSQWKTILSAVFLFLFIYFLKSQQTEFSEIKSVLLDANRNYIFLGIVILGIWTIFQAFLYQACFQVANASLPLGAAISLYMQRFALGTFIPAGATLSQFTYSSSLKSYGISELQSHLAAILYLLITALGYLIILLPTLVFLWIVGQLTQTELVVSWLVIIASLILIWEGVAVLRQKGMGYFLFKLFLPDLPQFLTSWKKRELNLRKLAKGIMFELFLHLSGVTLLLVSMLALNIVTSVEMALVGYVIALLVIIISPAFQGLGLVEFSLVYILVRFGLTKEEALATTLLYRVFQLWLPLIAGLGLTALHQFKYQLRAAK